MTRFPVCTVSDAAIHHLKGLCLIGAVASVRTRTSESQCRRQRLLERTFINPDKLDTPTRKDLDTKPTMLLQQISGTALNPRPVPCTPPPPSSIQQICMKGQACQTGRGLGRRVAPLVRGCFRACPCIQACGSGCGAGAGPPPPPEVQLHVSLHEVTLLGCMAMPRALQFYVLWYCVKAGAAVPPSSLGCELSSGIMCGTWWGHH